MIKVSNIKLDENETLVCQYCWECITDNEISETSVLTGYFHKVCAQNLEHDKDVIADQFHWRDMTNDYLDAKGR